MQLKDVVNWAFIMFCFVQLVNWVRQWLCECGTVWMSSHWDSSVILKDQCQYNVITLRELCHSQSQKSCSFSWISVQVVNTSSVQMTSSQTSITCLLRSLCMWTVCDYSCSWITGITNFHLFPPKISPCVTWDSILHVLIWCHTRKRTFQNCKNKSVEIIRSAA